MEAKINREMALMCVDVYHRALEWVVGLAAIEPKGRGEAEGFLLTGEEAEALGIPLREIYERIADNMRADPATRFTARELAYWKGGTRRFTVRDAEGRVQQGYPGERPWPGFIEQIEFMSKAMHLPFFDINCGLERAAPALGLKPRDLQFRWRNLPIHTGEALFQAVTLGGINPRRVLAAIGRWREETDARIDGKPEPGVSMEVLNVPPLPDELKGAILPRKRVMKLAGGCRRTLQRWDKQGYAAEGLPWVKGWCDAGGYVLYEVAKIWPTLAVLLGRGKNRQSMIERVRMLDREIQEWRREKRVRSVDEY